MSKRASRVPADEGAMPPRARAKLSLEKFSMRSFDGKPIALTGGRLDVYPLSERWVRGGMEASGGVGNTPLLGSRVDVRYGMLGLTAGFQVLGRVTPFVDGHFTCGILTGRLNGSIVTPGATVTGTSGTTWLYARGIDVGSEFHAFGRLYLSASLGWIRTTWASPDVTRAVATFGGTLALGDVVLTKITSDSLIWKLGIGI